MAQVVADILFLVIFVIGMIFAIDCLRRNEPFIQKLMSIVIILLGIYSMYEMILILMKDL